MTADDGLLEQARRAKARMEAARADARRAEADYHEAVRRLHEAGASVGEMAAGVDISEDAARIIIGAEPLSDLLRCSFCSKSQTEVRKLIAGPGVYICEACTAA
ncbi:MAG: ClpX C4-type zinc finger protein, partial [Acidimicrobiales bacterium]